MFALLTALLTCEPLVFADQPFWDLLRVLGWTGDPADGVEALYAPHC